MGKHFKIFIKDEEHGDNILKKAINITIVLLLFGFMINYTVKSRNYSFNWQAVSMYRIKIFNGYKMTILISFFSLFISLAIGFISAFMQRSKILILHYISKIYVETIRGTPFLVQIYIFYFIVSTAFGINNKYISGMIILSIFSGAYITEIIRAGIDSIPKTQHETSKSIGFTTFQKYLYIILPQVVKRIMPSLAGQLSSLVKDSSLLSVIAVSEFTLNILELTSLNFRYFENYILLGVGYLFITIPISLLSKFLERKYNYES